jgi:hypothetical protein
LVGLFFGAAGFGACTSVRHVQPAAYLEDNSPPVVWVTYINNTVVTVAEPVFKRDTLRGMLQGTRVKIPLGEIRSVEARVHDRTKTALLLSALGVAAISGLYFGFISKSEGAGSEGCGTDGYGDLIPEC